MHSSASFYQLIVHPNNEEKLYSFLKSLPSSGTTVRVTAFPASLMSCTMSLWDNSIIDWPFTAEMRSPTFSRPQRSVGLPSMMRPILCGITEDRQRSMLISFIHLRYTDRLEAPQNLRVRTDTYKYI